MKQWLLRKAAVVGDTSLLEAYQRLKNLVIFSLTLAFFLKDVLFTLKITSFLSSFISSFNKLLLRSFMCLEAVVKLPGLNLDDGAESSVGPALLLAAEHGHAAVCRRRLRKRFRISFHICYIKSLCINVISYISLYYII